MQSHTYFTNRTTDGLSPTHIINAADFTNQDAEEYSVEIHYYGECDGATLYLEISEDEVSWTKAQMSTIDEASRINYSARTQLYTRVRLHGARSGTNITATLMWV